MNETLDAAVTADQFTLAGIAPALTARLAAAVRERGAAAVHALGAGAVADWTTSRGVNALIASALDAGATKEQLANDLELVAQLQSMVSLELALL